MGTILVRFPNSLGRGTWLEQYEFRLRNNRQSKQLGIGTPPGESEYHFDRFKIYARRRCKYVQSLLLGMFSSNEQCIAWTIISLKVSLEEPVSAMFQTLRPTACCTGGIFVKLWNKNERSKNLLLGKDIQIFSCTNNTSDVNPKKQQTSEYDQVPPILALLFKIKRRIRGSYCCPVLLLLVLLLLVLLLLVLLLPQGDLRRWLPSLFSLLGEP